MRILPWIQRMNFRGNYLVACLSACLPVSTSLPVSLPTCLPLCLSLSLLPAYLFTRLPLYSSACPFSDLYLVGYIYEEVLASETKDGAVS